MMDHQEIRDSLAVLALGAMEPGEQAEIEGHLVDCEPCRHELRGLRHAVSLLAFGAEAEDVASPSRGTTRQVPDALAVAKSPAWRRVAVGVTVAAGVGLVALLGATLQGQGRELEALRADLAEPDAQAFANAAREPGTSAFSFRSPDGAIVLPSAITADGCGYLDGGPLPALPVDRTYQLWGVTDRRRVSLGVLGADPAVVSFDPRLFTDFAVTDERAGGVDASLRAAVVTGSLD